METNPHQVHYMLVKRITCVFILLCSSCWSFRAGAQNDLDIYADGLQPGWENWSWAATADVSQPVHTGSKALSAQAEAWQGVYFHHASLNPSSFSDLAFWVNGGSKGGQRFLLQGLLNGAPQTATNLPALPANQWIEFKIPLSNLGLLGGADFDGFWIQDRSGTSQPTFYLDDIRLIAGTSPAGSTNTEADVLIDFQSDRHSISPFIYGLAFASAEQLRDLNVPLNRSGGNAESRYNWQINAHNRAADWFFESLADDSSVPGAAADSFVSESKDGHAEAMLTVPMIGWAPKLGANRGRLASYSIAKYGAQTGADAQWYPDAGNGFRASDGKAITWNDPADANLPVNVSFQQSWIEHLISRWGRADQGGVHWFFMDNESSIWHASHRDVHPIGATMSEIRDKFFAYAQMVKQADSNALVAGPEEWGWSGYFYSGYDQQAGAANGYRQFPDRATNGGWDYLPWFLDQNRQESARSQKRLLDYFTVHYYPQGGEYGSNTSGNMQQLRNRSTRSLWDPKYVDESWIADKVMLIPRIKSWVSTNYPGTKIGLTEYNWGAESHINGATAQADLLGIFGREGLDLAVRWTTPATDTPVYNAIKLFRNYDGTHSGFGETSVRAVGPNPDQLSVFAAERAADHSATVMLVHKELNASLPVKIQFTNATPGSVIHNWQLTAANKIVPLPDLHFVGSEVALTLPAQSISLLVVPMATGPQLSVSRADVEKVEFQVSKTDGAFIVEQSKDLVKWTPSLTNRVVGIVFKFSVPIGSASLTFWRAREVSP